MSTACTFVLPAVAVETIGAHLRTFPQKLVMLADHYWDISRQDDGCYVIRCSREAAMSVARLLQAAGRSPVASVEKTLTCTETAGLILSELSRIAPFQRSDIDGHR